jgi:hypothetical protein
MTPKQKAKEIVYKMFADWLQIPYEAVEYHLEIPGFTIVQEWYSTKHCALIAVDEVLEATKKYDYTLGPNPSYNDYWLKVKYEIEKL